MSTTGKGDLATRLAKAYEAFRQEISFQDWAKTYEENSQLNDEIAELKTTYSINNRAVKRAEDERDEARKDADDLSTELKTTIKKHINLESERDIARAELKTAKETLARVEGELQRLRGFAVTLKPVSAEHQRRLRDLFTRAQTFAEVYFGADFTKDVLKDPDLWKTFRIQDLPLPLTNSVPAKKMRVATVLSIISETLIKHVFQPVYLDRQEERLAHHMRGLARQDDGQESYLRSVLLKSITPSPQKAAMPSCGETAAGELLKALGPFFKNKERNDKLFSAIRALCEYACSNWRCIQQIVNKVEPNLDFSLVDHTDWEALPFKLDQQTPDQKPQQNGNSSAPNGNSVANSGKAKQQPTKPSQPQSNGGRSDNSSFVVWPSFIFVSSEDPDEMPGILVPGYVLDMASLQAALDENSNIARESLKSSVGTRMRRNTMGAGGSDKSFLGQNGGGGSKAG
ncbi:hypothetical protein B0T16DRAFT_394936 [Cercophora newfieldiana]|uniref:Uncharacterized protein n=1 Tax=Cercophora newfieldiana TaxID=92897 RepID=A0AA40CI41_9PEZI|nr:hypothetical protein B0T16DRAFT_394936 [Cercophora newfieldiana]